MGPGAEDGPGGGRWRRLTGGNQNVLERAAFSLNGQRYLRDDSSVLAVFAGDLPEPLLGAADTERLTAHVNEPVSFAEAHGVARQFQAQENRYEQVIHEIFEEERPPMVEIPAYREKFGLDE